MRFCEKTLQIHRAIYAPLLETLEVTARLERREGTLLNLEVARRRPGISLDLFNSTILAIARSFRAKRVLPEDALLWIESEFAERACDQISDLTPRLEMAEELLPDEHFVNDGHNTEETFECQHPACAGVLSDLDTRELERERFHMLAMLRLEHLDELRKADPEQFKRSLARGAVLVGMEDDEAIEQRRHAEMVRQFPASATVSRAG